MPRILSNNHLAQYKQGGKLHKLFNVVDKDPELSFEIRRNDTVIVYYNKKAMITVSRGVSIKPLNSGYFGQSAGPTIDISDPTTWVSETLIKKYFNQAKDIVYKHSKKAEFAIQQNISLGSRSFDTGLVVVDMEWGFAQADIPEGERISKTLIDLIAVNPRKNDKGENDIYLIEVKHTFDATTGNSGMQDHVNKTNELCNCPAACQALVEDVKSILEQKLDLGIISGTKPNLNFAKIPKMMFFLSYRNQEELDALKKQVSGLVIPEGMEQPIIQYYNYTIQLSL